MKCGLTSTVCTIQRTLTLRSRYPIIARQYTITSSLSPRIGFVRNFAHLAIKIPIPGTIPVNANHPDDISISINIRWRNSLLKDTHSQFIINATNTVYFMREVMMDWSGEIVRFNIDNNIDFGVSLGYMGIRRLDMNEMTASFKFCG